MAGIKLDAGKARADILPPHAMLEVAQVFTFGNKKYSKSDRADANNYLQGMNYSRLMGAALRHLWAWWGGRDTDEESGLSHLAHATCCILMLLDYEQRGSYVGFDDRLSEDNVENNKTITYEKGE